MRDGDVASSLDVTLVLRGGFGSLIILRGCGGIGGSSSIPRCCIEATYYLLPEFTWPAGVYNPGRHVWMLQ